MKALGRMCQLGGLLVLPLAMFMELTNALGRDFGVSDMVIMLVFGASLFYAGRVVEGYSQT